MLFPFLLACTSPALEPRLAALEAQHAADEARIAALEEKLSTLDRIIAVAERMGPRIDGSSPGADPAAAVPNVDGTDADGTAPAVGDDSTGTVGEVCRLEGSTYILPARDALSADVLSRAVRTVPHRNEVGAVDGFRLSGIRRDRLISTCGFRNGDVLQSVSGAELSTPDLALRAYQTAHKASSFSAVVNRRGEHVELQFRWPK